MEFNSQVLPVLEAHQEQILEALIKLRKENPEDPLIKDIERLGGIGSLGLTLDGLQEVLKAEDHSTTKSFSNFVVAYLDTDSIQNHNRYARYP